MQKSDTQNSDMQTSDMQTSDMQSSDMQYSDVSSNSPNRMLIDSQYPLKTFEKLSLIDTIDILIKNYGLGVVLQYIDPLYALYKLHNSFLPKKEEIEHIVSAFKKLGNSELIKFFTVRRVLNQDSSNGKIIIIGLDNNSPANFLVKVPLSKNSDPLSYEYYCGLFINKLRVMNINHFSLVYGRFQCGFSSKIRAEDQICIKNAKRTTHVVYEYITNKSGKVQTLRDYIEEHIKIDENKTNIDVVNILIILMISLQKAQDAIDFTHYDLHASNVLIVRLNKTYRIKYTYIDKTYIIYTDVIPYIIDFGRCHVIDVDADPQVKYIDTDTDEDVEYDSFSQMQTALWTNKPFYADEEYDRAHVRKIVADDKARTYLQSLFPNHKITEDFIIDRFYRQSDITNNPMTLGITPQIFHSSYDHYRLVRGICTYMKRYNPFWKTIDTDLNNAFPFFNYGYFSLPTKYPSFTGKFNNPISLADKLYDAITNEPFHQYKKDSAIQLTSIKWDQIGGKKNKKNTSNTTINTMTDEQRILKASRNIKKYYRKHKNIENPFSNVKTSNVVVYDTPKYNVVNTVPRALEQDTKNN